MVRKLKDTLILRTQDVNTDINDIEAAAEILKNGGIVAIPTETVYGLAANALNVTAVKKIFTSKEVELDLKKNGVVLSSANSMNFGRLSPQITYYFSAYCDLVASGEIKIGDKINFVVPTGNFGNILACYIAKKMGLFIDKIVCASNENNILTDFLNTLVAPL